jgi:hypothetical protein
MTTTNSNALKRFSFKLLFIMAAIAGIPAMIQLFQTPSMERNAFLWGYSLGRIMTGGIYVIAMAGMLYLAVKAHIHPTWLNRFIDHLETRWLNHDHLLPALTYLLSVMLITSTTLLVFSFPTTQLGALQYLINSTAWGVAWAIIVLALMAALILINYRHIFTGKGFVQWPIIIRHLIIISILLLTYTHWMILVFKIRVFTVLPGWFWLYREKSFGINDLVFPLLMVTSLVILPLILKNFKRAAFNLMLLILLGYVLQVGFGFIEGQGFESVRLRYAKSGHKVYVQHAADQPSLQEVIIHYEEIYGEYQYLNTKPPGTLAIYVITQNVADMLYSPKNHSERVLATTTLIAYVFPLLSMLVLIVIYKIAKLVGGEEYAIVPCVLYVFSPNVILMPLFLDQVIYPLLFTLNIYFALRVIKDGAFNKAFLLGMFIYFSIFISFSMLAVLGLIAAFLVISGWSRRNEGYFSQALKPALGIFGGLSITLLIFRVAIGYDPFLRYANAMASHRAIKNFKSGSEQLLQSIFVNNLDFASWIGFAITLLVITYLVRTLASIRKNQTLLPLGELAFASIAAYTALNLLGQTRGEVGRLWLFWVPAVVMVAGRELKKIFGTKNKGLYLIVTLQLVTTYLLFKFQDFRA